MAYRSGFGQCSYQFVTNCMIRSLRTYAIFPGSYMRMGTTGESSLPYTIKPISLSFFRKYLQNEIKEMKRLYVECTKKKKCGRQRTIQSDRKQTITQKPLKLPYCSLNVCTANESPMLLYILPAHILWRETGQANFGIRNHTLARCIIAGGVVLSTVFEYLGSTGLK